ncbi:DUF3048 domain-containing protein [Cellulomonas edaphi]|uniref:DUF3048 domain-containing protein n=1 Tax=Cellulomonas edaphi TaxID=3053468 RepID=A0ABT7S9D2_9CELL|nr:DUF3048 domain-containing protein [Cellulomons edaphi]MDM7832230.1 DUF3048 domain-containing protein [Cellulomons edaphi]
MSARSVWVATAAVGSIALALTACSGDADPAPTPSPVVVGPTIEPSKAPAPTPSAEPVWPLTGVAGKPANRAALAVKIENTSQARPQTGLNEADVVWETIVEFQVSRYIAVYHSHVPAEVGPIRSVRPSDPIVLAPTKGLLAFSGGQRGILPLVAKAGLQPLSNDAGTPGMYRTHDRAAPHNVYGDPKTFWKSANARHQDSPAQQFLFARTAAESAAVAYGRAASKLDFHLSAASNPSWTWDGKAKKWNRSEGSTPATGRDGKRLVAVNVVSIVARHVDSGFNAQGGAPVPVYKLVGSGKGTVATGGKTIAVTWKKAATDEPLRLFTANGKPALLAPGNTWVELVPKEDGRLSISS